MRAADKRPAWVLFGLAAATAAALILWTGRGLTFSLDEIVWFMESPNLSFDMLVQPHFGHFVLTTRLVYEAVFDLFGATSYLPFRVLAALTVLLTVTLFFAYTSRRVGDWVALAPSLVLLVFGSDLLHVLVGNAFTVMFAVSCGLAAFLALDRQDRRGDIAACAFLCLGVVTYTVALGFVVGAAVRVALEPNRLRRAWIPLLPLAIYGAWWLSSHSQAVGPDSQTTASNVLLFPVWSFQSLGAILSAVAGLNYNFPGSGISGATQAGGVLAFAALGGLTLRLRQGKIPPAFWGAVAVLATLWLSQALAAAGSRPPDSSRYMFPGAIIVLIVAAEALRGIRWTPTALAVLYAFAVLGATGNLAQLRDVGATLRGTYAPEVRAAATALDLAGSHSSTNFEFPSLPEGQGTVIANQVSPFSLPFWFESSNGRQPVPLYLAAADRYGSLGYTQKELSGISNVVGTQVDAVLVTALKLELEPPPRSASGHCMLRTASPGESLTVSLPPGGAVVEAVGAGGEVDLSRFADEDTVFVGTLGADEKAALRIPHDAVREPWRVTTTAPAMRICGLR